MSDVEITVPVPEWLADSLALVAKICEKSIDQVASVLFARSASAPRERKEVYHKSPPLWAKRFTAEKCRLQAAPCFYGAPFAVNVVIFLCTPMSVICQQTERC